MVRTVPESCSGENTIAAAILGELIPELEYAAPLLLERADRGEPLVSATSPAEPGFETGAVDSVLLEFFRSLVPYVKLVLSWGVLSVAQTWLVSHRRSRRDGELLAILNGLLREHVELRQVVAKIAAMLTVRDGVSTSAEDVMQLIAAAISRVATTDGSERV